jgi:hypothetical protein
LLLAKRFQRLSDGKENRKLARRPNSTPARKNGGWQGQRPAAAITNRPTTDQIIETGGQRRVVKRVKTVCQAANAAGRVPIHLVLALDAYVEMQAISMGTATRDGDHSTAGLISVAYTGMPVQAHICGSRSYSDRQMDAAAEVAWIRTRIPKEQLPLHDLVVAQELAAFGGEKKTLTTTQIGEQRGYHHKQASAAGSTALYDLLALIAHLRCEYHLLRKKSPIPNKRNGSAFSNRIGEGNKHK